MDFFNLDAGKKVIDAFKGGHYLDSLEAAIELQKSALETLRKFDGFFGIKLNAVSPEVEAQYEVVFLELKGLTENIPVSAVEADKTKIDPMTILAIIQAITTILEFIKKRREQKNG